MEILKEIKDSSDEYQHVVLGTYTFEPSFFEAKILPIIQKRDAENILILLDPSEYREQFDSMQYAGQDYYVDFCSCKNVFHPKFSLFVWSGGAKLIIGSANMTDPGWQTSGELLTNIEINTEKPDQNSFSIFSEIRDFLGKLINYDLLKSTKHREKLKEALVSLNLLDIKLDKSQNIIALHNLDKPILNQVFDLIGTDTIEQVDICAPFFDSEGSVINEIFKRGCKTIRIFLQPEKVVGFPQEEILRLQSKKTNIEVFSISFKENSRFLHAKLMIIKTQNGVYCLTGSANPTKSGMLSTFLSGNVELCVLRTEQKYDYFDYIINPEYFEIKQLDPKGVSMHSYETKSAVEVLEIRLTEARLEGKDLVIGFESKKPLGKLKILLSHHTKEHLDFSNVEIQNNFIRINLDEPSFSFVSKPTFVILEAEINGIPVKSDRRWISTQDLELKPRRRDIEQIAKSSGRIGLIPFFNQLEKQSEDLGWFLYYLQQIEFDDLLGGLDFARRRLMKRNADAEEEGEAILEERPQIEAKKALTKIVNRNIKNLKKQFESLSVDKEFPHSFEKIFNRFMFLNKISLWFYLSKKSGVDELRHIRVALEEMIKVVRNLSNKDTQSIFNEFLVWEHLIIFAYLINQIHKSIWYPQSNRGVYSVFLDTYKEIMQSYGEQKFEDRQFRFEKAIKEYNDEFEIKIVVVDLLKFCEEIKILN